MTPTLLLFATIPLLAAAAAASPPTAAISFEEFARDLSPLVAARLDEAPKHYRQIEPSLHHLYVDHADRIGSLPREAQIDLLVKLARFLDSKRETAGDRTVIGPGCGIIGLLDPDRGLDPKEITAIATAYDTPATVFKKDGAGETIAGVADAFRAAVAAAAADERPTTVVVLGHGLPREIQSYSIPCDRLAETLVSGAASRKTTAGGSQIDLGHLTLICDDCYSADFSINLGAAIERECRERSLAIKGLPTMIAGTNRDCLGHADFGEKFVPHFWKDVIELFYIRRPRPDVIRLRDFFEKVDSMMYGYGRAAQVDGDGKVSYRLVDQTLCQDPVVFVPLDEEDLARLRQILGLAADAPLPRMLDIG